MSNELPKPVEVHALYAGTIDTAGVQRIAHGVAIATQNGVKRFHLMIQSTGGFVGDGVCLYNLFKSLPIELAVYNCGTISSAAVTAYLGAPIRNVSAFATFMIHPTHVSPAMANTGTLKALAHSIGIDDDRVEGILHERLNLTKRQWATHKTRDLWFTAKEAVECGLATEIAEFAPPVGTPLYSL